MRTFILGVMVFAGAWGLFVLTIPEIQAHRCHAAGFDRINRDGMCVYKSRYTNVDYITSPAQAAEFFPAVKNYEADERKQQKR